MEITKTGQRIKETTSDTDLEREHVLQNNGSLVQI